MTWTYGGVRIFVQERSIELEQIIARLNPIGGGTTLQVFGYDERIDKLNAYIVGNTDWARLTSFTTSGVAFALVSPYGTGDFYLKHVTSKDVKSICQTLRPDLPEDSPVYVVDMEFYYDV